MVALCGATAGCDGGACGACGACGKFGGKKFKYFIRLGILIYFNTCFLQRNFLNIPCYSKQFQRELGDVSEHSY